MKDLGNGVLVDRDTAIIENQGLAWKVAHKYKSHAVVAGMELEDIFQYGCIGLIKAYDNFDINKYESVKKFSTYAIPKIEGEILRWLRDSNPVAKFNRRAKRIARMIHKMDLYGMSTQKLAEILNEKEELVIEALQYKNNINYLSLDTPLYSDESSSKEITYENSFKSDEDFTTAHVNEFFEQLDERELVIVQDRLNDVSQDETGNKIGVSQVQVSRILSNHIKPKLKQYIA